MGSSNVFTETGRINDQLEFNKCVFNLTGTCVVDIKEPLYEFDPFNEPVYFPGTSLSLGIEDTTNGHISMLRITPKGVTLSIYDSAEIYNMSTASSEMPDPHREIAPEDLKPLVAKFLYVNSGSVCLWRKESWDFLGTVFPK